jgi:hypothetical protein
MFTGVPTVASVTCMSLSCQCHGAHNHATLCPLQRGPPAALTCCTPFPFTPSIGCLPSGSPRGFVTLHCSCRNRIAVLSSSSTPCFHVSVLGLLNMAHDCNRYTAPPHPRYNRVTTANTCPRRAKATATCLHRQLACSDTSALIFPAGHAHGV